jgi:Tol biopolymer transport system component
VAQNVGTQRRRSSVSLSGEGSLVYQEGSALSPTQLVWVDRQGKDLGVLAPSGAFFSPRLSHDGRRLAVDISAATTGWGDIWIFDLIRNVSSRLTFNPANESGPVWTSDDREIIYFSEREGHPANLYRISSGGTGEEQLLLDSPMSKLPAGISRDGQWLLFVGNQNRGASTDIWTYSLREKKAQPWLATPFAEGSPQLSPDGKWIVYQSNESGRNEIYVRSFPESQEKFLVSNGGGVMPAWRGDGGELYYLSEDQKMMAVPVTLTPKFESGTPVALFPTRLLDHPSLRQYDVVSDGSRFLLNRIATDDRHAPLTLVQNWMGRLKK